MKRKIQILVIFFSTFFGFINAQEFADKEFYLIDSLNFSEISFEDSLNIENGLKQYYTATSDSMKLAAIESIIDNSYHTASAFQYLIVLRNLATVCLDYPSKSEAYKNEIRYFLAASYYTTAFIQKDLGNNVSAKENYLEALKVFEEGNIRWAVATTFVSLGFISADIEEEIDYYKKALKIYEEIGDIEGESNVLINLADLSSLLSQEELTFQYLNRAIDLAESIDSKRMLAVALSSLAYNNNRFDVETNNNLELYQRSINISLEIEDYRNASISLVKFASAKYELNNDINQVDSIIRLAIIYSEKSNDVPSAAEAEYRLGTFYLKEGDRSKAKELMEASYIKYKQIDAERDITDVSEYLHKIHAEDKEFQNAYEILLELYEYDINNINNENKLLLSEQSIESEYQKQKEIDDLVHQQEIALEEEKNQKQKMALYGTGAGLLVFALLLAFIFNRMQVIRVQKAKLDDAYFKLEESKKNELAVSNLKALQSQMNPHFIFNALNSVQDLVLLNDVRNSNKFLGKFSDLIRKILLSSKEQFISLEEEVEILGLYLDLEKLRFGEEFNIDFSCDVPQEKQEEIQLPAMFIQPYIENAIKHGLFSKKGEKRLKVAFKMQDAQTLECIVEDNGIGQKQAALMKENRLHLHTGFSTEAINERIRLLNQTLDKRIDLQIIDLEENGKALGTKIVLHFPV